MMRWIMVSGVGPAINVETFAFDLAMELSLRASVLFWDVPGTCRPRGKEVQEVSPYRSVLSGSLLYNFLSYEGTSLNAIHGHPAGDAATRLDMFELFKKHYDFIFVALPPTWDELYLELLDSAQALLLVSSSDPSASPELASQMNALTQHKFPLALAHVISPEENIRTFAKRLETDPSFYYVSQELRPEETQKTKNRIHVRLLESSATPASSSPEQTQALLEQLIAEEKTLPSSRETRRQVFTNLLHDVLGLGPLEPLLKDPEVTEIMVNGPGLIFTEKKGQLHPTDIRFENEIHLRTVIDRIVSPVGRRVDESMPLCDARLADGSRVNIVLPPLALDGAVLTIRKFIQKRLELDDLIEMGALNQAMGDFLAGCVRARKNMIISGGTGSGKTTLLNLLSGFISPKERIVTIEDAAELKLQQPHVVRLESRPANAEGQGLISIRRLVTHALRMRPDRIVVGECRGGEALDMLQAMNTGHDGSLTTLHANSPRDALGRLEALVLMAGIDLPIRVVREQIKSAVHVIVQIARLSDGSRKITAITELTGMEGDVLTTAELFRYKNTQFESTGLVSQHVGCEDQNIQSRHCEGEACGNPDSQA